MLFVLDFGMYRLVCDKYPKKVRKCLRCGKNTASVLSSFCLSCMSLGYGFVDGRFFSGLKKDVDDLLDF